MPRIKYHYALDENGNIIDIIDVTKENRNAKRFFCINCGEEMIAKLGEVKARHFAHKVETPNCNSETYLHKLAKRRLKEKFDSSEHFEISYRQEVKCKDEDLCPFFNKEECVERRLKSFDLKKYYDTCNEEEREGDYIADLKISNSQNSKRPPVMIEIYVSHKCSLPKKNSGIRIIEIHIKEESDIQNLILNSLIEDGDCPYPNESRSPKCKFYGFNAEAKELELLNVRMIPRFYLFKSGSAFVPDMDEISPNCRDYNRKYNPNTILELNIDSSYFGTPSLYEIGYIKALDLGFEVKTCMLCKYRKDSLDFFNFCCLYKKYGTPQYPDSKDAMKCQYYKVDNDFVLQIQKFLERVKVTVVK